MISSSYSASRTRRRLARLVAPMYSGAAFGRAPACTPYVNWAFVLTAGTVSAAGDVAGDVARERDRAEHRGDHGRRDLVLLLRDEQAGQRRPLTGADGIR